MFANNQPFDEKLDALWVTAAVLFAFNLLNTAAWTIGFYLHSIVYCVAFIGVLLKWRQSNCWVLIITLVVFLMIVLGSSVISWDARSIWFFHGKRIFIDGSLYSQLDKYPGWSHGDYPTLLPALAASVARAFGYWNETLPKLAVLLTLSPVFIFFSRAFTSAALFNLWLASVLLVCGSMLLNGYVDAILALYCAAACVLLAEIYRSAFVRPANANNWLLHASLALVLANILLLKNEGLLAALLLWVCWLPQLYRCSSKTIAWQMLGLLLPLLFYFVVWKLPLIQNQVTGDTFLPGNIERFIERLKNAGELLEVATAFARICGLYLGGLGLILAYSFYQKTSQQIIPGAFFICGYWAALFLIYLMTPHPLAWLLSTSADRTWMVPNLCVVALGIYAIGLKKYQNHNYFSASQSNGEAEIMAPKIPP
jgi:hypothetical protein